MKNRGGRAGPFPNLIVIVVNRGGPVRLRRDKPLSYDGTKNIGFMDGHYLFYNRGDRLALKKRNALVINLTGFAYLISLCIVCF